MAHHYDAETLFRYIEGISPIAGEIEAHTAGCSACAAEISEQRRLVGTLQDERVWETELPAVSPERLEGVAALAARIRAEEETAAVLCERILTGPPRWWPQHVRKTKGAHTAGFVQHLLKRIRRMVERSPQSALQASMIAVDVARRLDPSDYPRQYITLLQAQALRNHAWVLSFMGYYPDALDVAERAKVLFEEVQGTSRSRYSATTPSSPASSPARPVSSGSRMSIMPSRYGRVLFWLFVAAFLLHAFLALNHAVAAGLSPAWIVPRVPGALVAVLGMLLSRAGREYPRARELWHWVVFFLWTELIVKIAIAVPDLAAGGSFLWMLTDVLFAVPALWMNAGYAREQADVNLERPVSIDSPHPQG